MKYKLIISLGLLFGFIVSSCQKDEIRTFDDEDRIHFKYVTAGLMSGVVNYAVVNFASYKGISSIVIGVEIQVMGDVSDQDRPVSFGLYDKYSNAILNEDIILLPSSIKAGRAVDTLWVQINNTERMKEEQVVATLKLKDNEYFKTDFTTTVHSYLNENTEIDGTEFIFIIENLLSMPNLWADLPTRFKPMFGDYSNRKYELMMNVCGFGPDYLTYDAAEETALEAFGRKGISNLSWSWIRMINAALTKYKNEHNGEEMMDENDKPIRLPMNYE